MPGNGQGETVSNHPADRELKVDNDLLVSLVLLGIEKQLICRGGADSPSPFTSQ